MTRVLVNALSATTGGGVTYAVEQLSALARDPDLDLTVLAVGATASALRDQAPRIRVREHPRRTLPQRVAYEQLVLPLAQSRFDILYAIGNFACFGWLKPQVVTFQNPNHFGAHARSWLSRNGTGRYRLRMAVERAAARASLLHATQPIAISRSLRSAMIEEVGDRPIAIIMSGTPELPEPRPPRDRRPPDRYVLAVANDYPHKDWDALIEQFLADPSLPPLLLVGQPRSDARREELSTRMRGRDGRVVLWGSEHDRGVLAWLYAHAATYVAHSFLEACPLTPSEALARGTPVVASDIPIHREVCGDAATFYPPDRPAEMRPLVRQAVEAERTLDASPLLTWTDNARELAARLREAGARA